MNTKKYKKLLAQLRDDGEIPNELYDKISAEIEKRGKMTKAVYGMFLRELEVRRLFNVETVPYDTENSAKTDGTFKYRHPHNPLRAVFHAIIAGGLKLVSYPAAAIGFGVWRIKDRKKLKGIKACVTLSNHVGFLDSILTRRALGFKKAYAIVAPFNCKNNLGGWMLNVGGCVPLPSSFRGTKPFTEMLEYAKKKNSAIHFYAEQSMWIRYDKPRPYKDGAFFYADKLDLPTVPMFYCFAAPRGLRKLLHMPKVVVKIGEPIYPDRALPANRRIVDLRDRAMAETQKLYEEFFGKPLAYIDETACDSAETGDTNGKNYSDR